MKKHFNKAALAAVATTAASTSHAAIGTDIATAVTGMVAEITPMGVAAVGVAVAVGVISYGIRYARGGR